MKYAGLVCYDGECPLCIGLITRWGLRLRRAGYRIARLQEPWVQRRLRLNGIPDEMKLLQSDGTILGGAEALVAIAGGLGLSATLVSSARSRVMQAILQAFYKLVARHRGCVAGACELGRR